MPKGIYIHKTASVETKLKMSIAQTGRKQSKESIEKGKATRKAIGYTGPSLLMTAKSVLTKRKIDYSLLSDEEIIGIYSDLNREETRFCGCPCGGPFVCKAKSTQRFIRGHAHIGTKATKETKLKMSKVRVGRPQPSKLGNKNAAGKRTEVTKQKLKEKRNLYLANGGVDSRKGKTKETSESVRKTAANHKLRWQDPKFKERRIAELRTNLENSPNKEESKVLALLVEIDHSWEFCGDGKVWINHKNPDFINRRTRQLVEHFGNYWHQGQDPTVRINHFRKYNWDTFVTWSTDLKDLKSLKVKLQDFTMQGAIK